jgi:hypothetical protein
MATACATDAGELKSAVAMFCWVADADACEAGDEMFADAMLTAELVAVALASDAGEKKDADASFA